MPQFEHKSFKFTNRGMTLNRPIDAIPEEQWSFLKNVRSYVDGRIEARPGLEIVCNDLIPGAGTDYIHSGYTLIDTNPDSSGDSLRFIGYNDELDVCPATNPAASSLCDTGFSGKPLSMVAVNPDESPVPWLYVADTNKMRKYSASFLGGGVPLPYQIGLPTPTDVPFLNLTTGVLTGSYSYRFRYRDLATGAKSNPGPANYAPLALSGQGVGITLPSPGGTVVVDVFRLGGAVLDWRLVATGASGAGITDTMTDSDALQAETLDRDENGRFIRYQPFPTIDVQRSGTCNTTAATLSQSGSDLVIDAVDDTKVTSASYTFVAGDIGRTLRILSGTGFNLGSYTISFVAAGVATLSASAGVAGSTGGVWDEPTSNGNGSYVTRTGGDLFNAAWEPGGVISINEVPYTLRRYVSPGVWEIQEDAGVQAGVAWSIEGAIILGQPLPHIWGPTPGAIYIFGCGDPRRPGALYWTNANDPDSTSLANYLEITGPSEPLVNGCVYDGRVFVWSTERMFQVFGAGDGQFIAQVVPGGKGLFAPWGLCVGEHIFFISKDGIYVTTGGAPQCITDDQLYPCFPHDGQPGYSFQRAGETLYAPDPAYPERWRLSYGDGMLYFDFWDTGDGGAVAGSAKTWVFDTRNLKGGWIRDDYSFGGAVSRYWEDTFHSMLVGAGSVLYQFTGVDDGGFDIPCHVQSGAWDCGESRAKKLLGDVVFTSNPNAVELTVKILGDNNTTELASTTTSAGAWSQLLIDLNSGLGALSRTIGIDIAWNSSGATPELYEWHPSWVPKPETTGKRATDWTNDGQAAAKWVRGCVIEGDISTISATDLVVDGANNKKVTSATHGFVAADVGAIIAITSGANWTLGEYEVASIDGTAAILDRSPAAVGIAGGGYALGGVRTVQVQSDGAVLRATLTVSHPGQTEHPYSFTPFVAHEMRLVPTDTATWQEFAVRWLWDPYPEYLGDIPDFDDAGYPGWKYVRGLVVTGDTQGVAVNLQAQYDSGTVAGTLPITFAGRSQATFAFATPFPAQLLRIVPLGKWRKFAIRWIFDQQPDFGQMLTPWMPSGSGASNHLRGVILDVDTANALVKFDVQGDGGATLYTDLEVTANGQTELPVYFTTPKVTHLARLVPKGNWKLWMPNLRWVSDPWPELTRFVTPWSDAGHLGAKYVRGLKMKADSGNLGTPIQVQRETGAVLGTLVAQHNGPEVKPYTLTPAVAALLRLVPLGNIRIWDDQIEWICDSYPELATFTTEWWNGEYPYAKYMQGMRLTADTLGIPIPIQIQYDGGVVGATVTVTHNGKQTLPYSWEPFIGHNFRIVPLAPIRIFAEPSWVWEPVPELTHRWRTQETNHDIPGWHHLRDGFVAHQSTSDVTLRIRFEGQTINYTLANGGGQYARTYLEFQPMKARYRSYDLFCASGAPLRLFVKDTEIRTKGWGSDGPYQSVRPFGDLHREAGARI